MRLPGGSRRALHRWTMAGLFLVLTAGAPPAYRPPFGPWSRLNGGEPILTPQGDGFEARGVFNPAVVRDGDRYVMLYRAQDAKGISRLGVATSTDGVRFVRERDPALRPGAAYEIGGGVEDPRLQKIGPTFYLTYTAYDGRDAQLALATSTDLRRWERRGVILPANRGRWNVKWTKSGAILGEPVGGRYWMYYMADAASGSDQMGVAYSEDRLHWTEARDAPVLARRPGFFDSRVVEPGPPPVMTPEGILLVYNGADDRLAYRTGWVLFDRQDPTRVIARADTPIFEPQRAWELEGQVPNVVFVEGLVRDGGRWLFYYGGADRSVGVAEALARGPRSSRGR
jgi:beta-1,2-mannosidase